MRSEVHARHWNDDGVEHLAEHDVTPEEFEEVVSNPVHLGGSRTSGRPIAFGWTSSGRYLACVFELVDDSTVLPITAYEVDA